jgi:hypothetical protein
LIRRQPRRASTWIRRKGRTHAPPPPRSSAPRPCLGITDIEKLGIALGYSRAGWWRARVGLNDPRLSDARRIARRLGCPSDDVFEAAPMPDLSKHHQRIGRIGAHQLRHPHPRTGGHRKQAAAAGRMRRFLEMVPAEITDPAERQRRALALQKAHMQGIAAKSAATRRKKPARGGFDHHMKQRPQPASRRG